MRGNNGSTGRAPTKGDRWTASDVRFPASSPEHGPAVSNRSETPLSGACVRSRRLVVEPAGPDGSGVPGRLAYLCGGGSTGNGVKHAVVIAQHTTVAQDT